MADPVTVAASAPVLASASEAGLIAGILGFVAGWGIFILSAFVIFGILSEHNKSSGWAVFWLILALPVAWLTFSVSWITLAVGAAAYIAIGLVWSWWRYKRQITETIEKYKSSDSYAREAALRSVHPKQMLGTITAWVVVWPFSMVENVVGDVINFVQTLITKFFRGIYYSIYNSAVEKLK